MLMTKKIQYQDLDFVKGQRWPEVDCKEGQRRYHMFFKENNKNNKCFMLFVFIQIRGQYLTSEGILHSVPEESALLQKLQCSCPQNQNQNTC